jgi:hypothetical protein
MDRTLSLTQAGQLALLLDMVGKRVARAQEDGSVLKGTARHFVKDPERAGFLGPQDDVRDAYLRVTLTSGFEAFWLVSDLMPETAAGSAHFMVYDWS